MRTAFERARSALDWEFERIDRSRPISRRIGRYGLYRQLSENCWQAQQLGVYDGPDLTIFIRRLHCRLDRLGNDRSPLQRYSEIRDHHEELYDLGKIEGVIFLATRHIAGASVARVGQTLGQLSWAAGLALCCLGLEALERVHRAGLSNDERASSRNLRLWLAKHGALAVLCGAYPLRIEDEQLVIVDRQPRREVERWQMVLSLLSLAGLRPIERAAELLANGSAEARLILADLVLEQTPSPYDEGLVYLVEGDGADHASWVSELERWLGQQLDATEAQRIWQAAADHDLSLREK